MVTRGTRISTLLSNGFLTWLRLENWHKHIHYNDAARLSSKCDFFGLVAVMLSTISLQFHNREYCRG